MAVRKTSNPTHSRMPKTPHPAALLNTLNAAPSENPASATPRNRPKLLKFVIRLVFIAVSHYAIPGSTWMTNEKPPIRQASQFSNPIFRRRVFTLA
jgi:hypothetical protein